MHVRDVDQAALAACERELPQLTQSTADVASLADVERLFADVRLELGGLDVLVNAGIAGPTAKVEDTQVLSEYAGRAKSAWARLIRKVYEADPLECPLLADSGLY